jgi:hypothetical protein
MASTGFSPQCEKRLRRLRSDALKDGARRAFRSRQPLHDGIGLRPRVHHETAAHHVVDAAGLLSLVDLFLCGLATLDAGIIGRLRASLIRKTTPILAR